MLVLFCDAFVFCTLYMLQIPFPLCCTLLVLSHNLQVLLGLSKEALSLQKKTKSELQGQLKRSQTTKGTTQDKLDAALKEHAAAQDVSFNCSNFISCSSVFLCTKQHRVPLAGQFGEYHAFCVL